MRSGPAASGTSTAAIPPRDPCRLRWKRTHRWWGRRPFRSRLPRRTTTSSRELLRAAKFGEQAFVLPQHNVPPVVLPHVFAPVAPEAGAQALVADEQLQAFDELVAVGVVQAAVAADAVLDERRAARVG